MQIGVSDDFGKLVDSVKRAKGFEDSKDAVDYIGRTFSARFKALRNYAAKHKGEAKPAKKAKKAKAAKA